MIFSTLNSSTIGVSIVLIYFIIGILTLKLFQNASSGLATSARRRLPTGPSDNWPPLDIELPIYNY